MAKRQTAKEIKYRTSIIMREQKGVKQFPDLFKGVLVAFCEPGKTPVAVNCNCFIRG